MKNRQGVCYGKKSLNLRTNKKAELSVQFPESPHLPAGLAARSVFHLPYTILKDTISDVVLLIEDEILDGIRMALTTTHNLACGAGAVSLMPAYKIRDRLSGKKVVMIMSGGNLNMDTLKTALGC